NAEESGAGAKHILSLGIFEKYCVQELYALHNLPKMKKGIYCKEGLLMAQSSEMNIHVLGQGGHVGFQKQLIDPMKTATLFLKYLHDHQLKNEPNICHIGKIESGEIRNGIAQEANLYGTIRCFNENDMKKLQQQLQEKLLEFDDLFHTQSNIIFLNEYPALMNDVHLVSKIKQLSEDDFHEIKSLCLSEDFSYYQDVCKTCYFLCGNPCNYELHTSKFMAMEEDYLIAIELNVRIVENSM
ncbi:MAG: M20/M25/M40 family metallo-hydrolase, partial [Traorella sp.]